MGNNKSTWSGLIPFWWDTSYIRSSPDSSLLAEVGLACETNGSNSLQEPQGKEAPISRSESLAPRRI